MPRFSVRREMSAPGGAPGSTRTAAPARAAMSGLLRGCLFGTGALLWLSGCAWLVVHLGFQQPGPFGPLPHPAEALLLRIHGLTAVAGVFLLGWVASAHLMERWGIPHNRRSGIVLAASGALLVLSGYALYYSTGALHQAAAGVHEALGVAVLLAAVTHWWKVAAAARR